MADIKTLLKEARKFIDEKNNKEAQECCKAILRKDKQNYFALVLLGKSLEDSDQAPLAYQKAIASKRDHILAWQGLANYYERKDDIANKTKLLNVYDEILKLQLEEEKAVEIITKVGQIGCTLNSADSVDILAKYLSSDLNGKPQVEAEKQLIELLKAEIYSEKEIPLLLATLNKIYAKDPNDNLELLIAKTIIKKSEFAAAIEKVINLPYFSKNVILREYLCKYLCDKYVENESFRNFPVEDHIENIVKGIENSKYPGLLKSIILYKNGLYLEAYKSCVPLINYHETDATEATFILKCTIRLKKWPVTQKLAVNFMSKTKDELLYLKLRIFLFKAVAKQQRWKQAIAIAKDVPDTTFSVEDQALLAECLIESNEPVNDLMQKLEGTEFYTGLQSLRLIKQNKYSEVIILLENGEENAVNLFYLGKAYWELKQYDKCLVSLLKAAKIDSEYPYIFLYLGHYYNEYKQDLEKAKKCYEKAYNINNIDHEIVRSLSDVYTNLKLRDSDFELLVTSQKNFSVNMSWISFRLGLHYLNKRDWETAIVQFRNVIKTDPNNVTAFECLADAYYSRGSFTSGLRAYDKVMGLDSTKIPHCLTRKGYIYSLLTQYEEAVSTFEQVLKIDSKSLLALKGIAETWIRIAKKKETAKMYGTAKDCAQHAVTYITKALSIQQKFTCLWKLLADTLIFITKLPNKYAHVYTKKSFDSTDEVIKKDKVDIYLQAISCYSVIARQKHQVASYDLATTYLDYYHETKILRNCYIAFNLTTSCLREKPLVWRNWNLFGKICLFIKKYHLAQHCFIKALLVTRKWSIAKVWCNLGTLYLKLKLNKLANYCFWRGQSTLPSYPQSWIGQALIAEEIREEEAMDLFRHASRLGYHPESALGYADWVCRTLKNQGYQIDPQLKYEIDGLHAITCAMDSVEWYSNFDPNNAYACTVLGILQERSGLLRGALKSYEKALQYAPDDKKNIALLNMGRILVRLEKYEEAIKVYKAITEASLNSTSGLALALYKNGLYEESYSVYDTALHWLSNEDIEKADLLVAMAGIVYMFKGADDAKTLLFHSIQISQKKPTAYSLFAICSLGLIHSDQSLSKLALTELHKYESDVNFGFDIGFLKSYLSVSQNSMDDAIKVLSESLHDHPSNALLWFYMAQYLLKASTLKARAASSCAQRALCCNENECDSGKIIATASVAEHVAGNRDKAFLVAKKGLHLHPHRAEIWAAVILSIVPHKAWAERKDWILGATSHVRKHLEISRQLSRWVVFMEKKLQVGH